MGGSEIAADVAALPLDLLGESLPFCAATAAFASSSNGAKFVLDWETPPKGVAATWGFELRASGGDIGVGAFGE